MRKFAIISLLFVSFGTAARANDPAPVCPKTRFLVVPFANETKSRSQTHFSIGLAASLAERFDGADCIESVNGPLVLTAEQALLVSGPNDDIVDLDAASSLASSKGATRLLTGSYTGTAEAWNLTVNVYTVGTQPTLIGTATVAGTQIEYVKTRGGRSVPVVGMTAIHSMLALATADALSASGTPLPPDALAAIARPATNDSYAYILMSRALRRHFRGEGGDGESAIAVAEHAVRVDPKYAEAQRFYAFLLAERGKPKKARIHYEEVLKLRSDDIRSLIALGMIEIDEKNPAVAKGYLSKAVAARPNDAQTHFWLGRAKLELKDTEGAIAEFETASRLDRFSMEPRRKLVDLYSADRQYGKAAEKLRDIVVAEPDNAEVRFQLAACLRAGGYKQEAVTVYEEASARFPKEPRFSAFKNDLLDPKADGLTELVKRVSSGKSLIVSMEKGRELFQDAANDAVMNLGIDRKDGCKASIASATLADQTGDAYVALGKNLQSDAEFVRRSFERGHAAALSPDEIETAKQVLAYAESSKRDLREMTTLDRRSVSPLLSRYGCKRDEHASPAGAAEVRVRNDMRLVHIEAAKPMTGGTISPEVPPDPARIIRFTVKNDADIEYVVTVDSDPDRQASIPPQKEITLTARVGTHRLCVSPKGTACNEQTIRVVALYDQWTLTVKPAD